MQGYALLRRPRSGRFSAFCDPAFPSSRSSVVPLFRGFGVHVVPTATQLRR